ncbi:hypothetical protein KDAU_09710 [Dictyobacter aurantiacus]|uniref:Uncharacterized protein n=1 Tax=Dictyobacter aurantiacus TaxID=1936993 RepID=A0A401Z9Y1_9CHLR|nr:hypothetical protein KDAU_09710 [Dictyobacter aurantiacus]
MLRMRFPILGKRVCQVWLPVGVVQYVLCPDKQWAELFALIDRAIWSVGGGTALPVGQVVSITRERGIACG